MRRPNFGRSERTRTIAVSSAVGSGHFFFFLVPHIMPEPKKRESPVHPPRSRSPPWPRVPLIRGTIGSSSPQHGSSLDLAGQHRCTEPSPCSKTTNRLPQKKTPMQQKCDVGSTKIGLQLQPFSESSSLSPFVDEVVANKNTSFNKKNCWFQQKNVTSRKNKKKGW